LFAHHHVLNSKCTKIIILDSTNSAMNNMSHYNRRVLIAAISLFTLLAFSTATGAAEYLFEVESITLNVYRDGLVHVTQTLIVNELAPDVTIPLMSPSIENLIVLDENQLAIDYQIVRGNLTIYTLGTERVLVEYDTISLTKKVAEVWTLDADNPYNATVFLPQNSTVIYLSDMPTAIDISGTEITLLLRPGAWEISYIVPLVPQDELGGDETPSAPIATEYLTAAVVAVASVVLSALFLVKRRKGPDVNKILKANPQLRKEDKDVILFLAEKDGKAFEAEIRERFPDMARTSLWRLVRRLERLEIVEVKRIGLENQVQLKK
jgi:uncharacterized membrane protein